MAAIFESGSGNNKRWCIYYYHLSLFIWLDNCLNVLPETSFSLQVLSLPVSVCPSVRVTTFTGATYGRHICLSAYPCVRPCVNPALVRVITCGPFELGSLDLNHRCKTTWLRFLLFCGVIDFDFQGQFELQIQNVAHFELVHAIAHHQLKLEPGNVDKRCKTPWLKSLLFWAFIDLDRSNIASFNFTFLFICIVLRLRNICETWKSRVCWIVPHPTWLRRHSDSYMHANRLVPWTMKQSSLLSPLEFSQLSTGHLALNFTSWYLFLLNYTHLTCRNFIYQHSAVAETTVKQRPLAFIFFDFQQWEAGFVCTSVTFYGSVLVSWCAKKTAYPNCSGRVITAPEDF